VITDFECYVIDQSTATGLSCYLGRRTSFTESYVFLTKLETGFVETFTGTKSAKSDDLFADLPVTVAAEDRLEVYFSPNDVLCDYDCRLQGATITYTVQ